MSATLDIPGTVEGFEYADLYAKVAGYIQDWNVDIGDRVQKGQTLAVIYVPELHDELRQAQAEQASRLAALEYAKANVVAMQAKLDVARRELPPQQATAWLKEVTFKRLSVLTKEKAATDQDMDDITAGRDASVAEVEVIKAKITAAEADLEVTKAASVLAQQQLEVAKAQVQRLGTLLAYTQIIAPFDGIVTRRTINRGDMVQAATSDRGVPLYRVQRTDVMRIFAEAPEADAAWIAPGVPAVVEPYGLPGTKFQGAVTRTAGAIDAVTRTLRTEVDLPNPDGRLLHGMYVMVRFQRDHTSSTSRPAEKNP